MGTKNIARTAIEGGRYWGNSLDRGWSTRSERAAVREWVGRGDTEGVPVPARRPVRKSFHDKLAAPRRWLWSHIGRPWAEVHAEIRRRFDTRTTAGRHIVFCHLLNWVVDHAAVHELRWYRRDYLIVDEDGILRRGPGRRPRRALAPGKVRRSRAAAQFWAAGRKVGRRGAFLFWFVPAGRELDCAAPPGLRQDRRLSDEEAAFWDSLVAELQEELQVVVS
jgi:hypothetical protein